MAALDKAMGVRVPRADLNQGASRTDRVSGRTDTESARAAEADGAQSASADTVTLTSKAADLRKLEEHLASVPDVDQARVDAIVAAIQEGSYQVDTSRIVDQLLSVEKTLR